MTKVYCDIHTCKYYVNEVCTKDKINLIEDEFGELVCIDFERKEQKAKVLR